MNYVSCPTRIVNAPVEIVWALLTRPEGWGDFYDLRVMAVGPSGPAVVGQTVFAESGPWFLHLKVVFRFTAIDAVNYRLTLHVQFPFGVTIREDLNCVPVELVKCRVNYHCDFGFRAGWRGVATRFLLGRELDAGPLDSLTRLQLAAERLYTISQTSAG